MTLKKILIPIDGSPPALKAVAQGTDLARRTGAAITLLYVYDSSVVAMMGLSTSDGKAVDDAVERVSKTHLEAAKASVAADIVVKTESRVGHPAEEICLYAEAGDFDMIVIGSRGMSPAKSFLVGSVSARVARHAPCSVLVVR
ncbi:MAG: universal stress protein [Deltaproteobacteria bacterium]|nr:universal stress protein [Deltaproteobacteria bacterium]